MALWAPSGSVSGSLVVGSCRPQEPDMRELHSSPRWVGNARRAFAHAPVRYLFGLAMAAGAFGLRMLLCPWTGKGAPFVLFYGATLLTSLLGGVGPGLMVLLISMPLATLTFAVPGGATLKHAVLQALLYGADGLAIVYLTRLMQVTQRRLRRANRELREAAESLRGSEARTRDIIELSPDAYFQSTLEGRLVDVNQAACDSLGYARGELIGKRIVDIVGAEQSERLEAVKRELLTPGTVNRGEWPQRCKDGTTILVEASVNILPDGRWQAFARDIGERKRAEAERLSTMDRLRESEEQFRLVFEEAPIGVAVVALDGRFVHVNRALCEILGYARAELERLTSQEITPPEDLQASLEFRERLHRGEAPKYQFEKRYLRKDGSPVSISVNGSIVRDRQGRPLHYIAQIEDITDRIRAQEALRFSEAKFSGIVSISADAIISIDVAEKITVFNTGAEKIFGYTRDEVLGAPLDLLIPRSARQGHRHRVVRFADGDGDGEVAARQPADRLASISGRRKSGEEFPAEASISSLQVGDTRVLTIVLRDVTEREQLEREQAILGEVGVALAATLDYDQTLATVAEIAVRDLADWCIVEVVEPGDGLRRLKVVSADPAKADVAERLETVQPERERSLLTRSMVASRQPWLATRLTEAEIEAAAPGAEHRAILREVDPASMMSVPLRLRNGLYGTLTFISSKGSHLFGPKDLRLAKAVAERASLALENARLYRSALEATGLRDHVLGFVAHDLRNPLSAIALHAAALRGKRSQADRRNPRHREAIERAARRMNRLIQDLLDVAVLEGGRLSVEKAPLAPRELVGEAAEVQHALAAASSIDLRVDVAPEAPQILGDRDRLLQVFENLIGNALKFTKAGGQVSVGAAPHEAGTLFWVADTGRGMTREEQARAFDRFWQASAHSGRLGAGLGLPITKGIVEAHGGRIWVESTPGRGSTFFFIIPAATPMDTRAGVALH
jgi:PAS domain S-box-containing protein